MRHEIHDIDSFQAARARWIELFEAGEMESALALVEDALPWAEASGNRVLLDRARCNQAAIAIELGRGCELVPALREVLMRGDDADNSFLAAYTLARHYELRKEAKKGLFYAQLANDRAEALDRQRQASSQNHIANLLVAESRFAEAAEIYRCALDLLPSRTELRAAVIGYNLGYCEVMTGRKEVGLAELYRSLRALLKLGAARHEMKARLDLAFALLESDRPELADRHAKRAEKLAERLEDAEARKNSLYLRGASAQARGDRFAARRHFARLQAGFYPDADYLPELLVAIDVRSLVNLKA